MDILLVYVLPAVVTFLCTNIVFKSRILAYIVATLVTTIITALIPSDAQGYVGVGLLFTFVLPVNAIVCGVVALILKFLSQKKSHDEP